MKIASLSLTIVCAVACHFCGTSTVVADVVRYQDEKGNVKYVDDLSKVPERYKDSVVSKELPPLSKAKSFNYELVPGTASAGNVDIFVTSWCPHCKSLESYLQRRGIQYARHDIEHDSRARKAYMELGGGGVPLVKVKNNILHGFSQPDLEEALGR